MAFLDKLTQVAKNIGDKATDVAKNIGEKTTDVIDITRLNSKISSECAAAEKVLVKIGEYYYGVFASGGEVSPDVLELCNTAKAHYDTAQAAQAEVERIKSEPTIPSAATSAAPAAPETQAPSEAAAPAEPVSPSSVELELPEVSVRICAACGTQLNPGSNFCPSCGHKAEN